VIEIKKEYVRRFGCLISWGGLGAARPGVAAFVWCTIGIRADTGTIPEWRGQTGASRKLETG
jgi:hypothetical protein